MRTNIHLFVTGFSLVAVLALGAPARGAVAPDAVLIVHSNERPTPAAIVIGDTMRKVVPEGLGRPLEMFSEYLDIVRFSAEDYGRANAVFLHQKYSGRNIRVIVVSGPAALQFVARFRNQILPGVPVVHVAVPQDEMESLKLPPDFVGKTIDLDPTATLALALRLHPGAKRLVMVVGATERDRIWEQRLRKSVGQLGTGIAVEYLSGLPTAEVRRRLGELPREAIVFTPGYFVDGTGQVGTPRQSVEVIVAASAAPVYGALDTFLGAGVVGGYVAPYEDQAQQAGAIVVRLLNGTAPTAIAPMQVANVPVVDWRALRRWGIDESLLPADALVRYREPTAWDRYRREISIGIAILLLQAGLIAALLVQWRSRDRMASALEESQKRMNLAASAARLSTWIWDVARDRLSVTTYPRQHAGEPTERPTDFRNVLASAHPADREQLDDAVRKALATGEELDVEYRVPGDGDVRWIAARGRAETGNGRRMLGVAVDITERKLAELRAVEDRAALRHMTRASMLGQLSASIAHQLNQPLAAILGNAEAAQKMLAREGVDLAELRAICDDIVADDSRAAEIIRRLSALYKRGEMKMEELDLNELIRETLDLLRAELLIRHIAPRTELASTLSPVEGDRVQLQQVLLNLVLNAADAMGGVGADYRRLLIRTQAAGAEVRLYVVDNGTGIRGGDLRNVFDAFWSTKPEGMGIGLAICQSIITAHRGRITATNNAEGGATFCVTLPVGRPA